MFTKLKTTTLAVVTAAATLVQANPAAAYNAGGVDVLPWWGIFAPSGGAWTEAPGGTCFDNSTQAAHQPFANGTALVRFGPPGTNGNYGQVIHDGDNITATYEDNATSAWTFWKRVPQNQSQM